MLKEAQNYLYNKKILILDKSSTSRQLIESALQKLGIDSSLIHSLKSFDTAIEFIRLQQPDIIFTDFQIYDRFGLDLLPHQAEYVASHTQKIFIVVTENANDSAVADAAEEDVDGYILKPFTIDNIVDHLLKIIELKLVPNHYQTLLEKAKKSMQHNHLEDAIIHLDMAASLHQKPTLALYYLGEIARQKNQTQLALSYFRKAQEITRLHFRCLIAEFTTLYGAGDYHQAYVLLKTITEHYPLSPKLLKEAFCLCIYSYKYEDVEKYYQSFLQLGRKTDPLRDAISKAFMEAGTQLLESKKSDEALDYFLKGTVVNNKNEIYMKTVTDLLIARNYISEVETYVGMFDIEEIGENLFRHLIFKISSAKLPYDQVISEGKNLIQNGKATPEIYLHVFDLLRNTHEKQLLKDLVLQAITQFPENKGNFAPYLPR